MKKENIQKQLIENMKRLDKTFKLKLNESGGHAMFGSIAFDPQRQPQRTPVEGEVNLSTLQPNDTFISADDAQKPNPIKFRVWGKNPMGGVDVQYIDYKEPRPNYAMRDDTKVIKLSELAEEKEMLDERLVTYSSKIHNELKKVPGLKMIDLWTHASGIIGLYEYGFNTPELGNEVKGYYEIDIRPAEVGQWRDKWKEKIPPEQENNL